MNGCALFPCRRHNPSRAIKAAEEMDIVLDEFDDVLLDEDDVTPHQQQAAKLKAFASECEPTGHLRQAELAVLLADAILPVHVSKAVAGSSGRAAPALQPLLSAASVRALDLAKARAPKPAPTPVRTHRRMPRNRRFKQARQAAQAGSPAADA